MDAAAKQFAKLARFIASVKSRADRNGGFGLAADSLAGVMALTGGSVSAAKLADIPEQRLAVCMGEAENKLSYRDSNAVIVGTRAAGGTWTGTPSANAIKDVGDATDGTSQQAAIGVTKSIMDFECILTSKRRDRDKDILHPDGASVDPMMPLLWQHSPWEPIGKLYKVTDQNAEFVRVTCGIADTALGRDAATLVEFGALRISHGFYPTDFEPITEEGKEYPTGWDVKKYDVLEVSVVSVPSNVDAIITASSRMKLHTAIVKGWADGIAASRNPLVVGGWNGGGGGGGWDAKSIGGITVNVSIDGTKGSAAAGTGTAPAKKDDAPPPSDPPAGNDPPKTDPVADDNKPSGNPMLADLTAAVANLTGAANLPQEAASRLNIVSGMIADIGTAMNDHADDAADGASDEDLIAIAEAHETLIAVAVGKLQDVATELTTIAGIDGLPDGFADSANAAATLASDLANGLATAAPDEDAVADATDGDGDAGGDADPNPGPPDQNGYSAPAMKAAKGLLAQLAIGDRIDPDLAEALAGFLN